MKLPRHARLVSAPKAQPMQGWWWRRIIPGITVLLLVLASHISLHVFQQIHVVPLLALMGVYFWSIYWPESLPLWFLFAGGLINDLLSSDPLFGISAFAFVGLHWIVVLQNNFFRAQNFIVVWAGFVLLSLIIVLIQFLFSMIFLSNHLFFPFMASVIVSAILYPLIVRVLHGALRLAHMPLPDR